MARMNSSKGVIKPDTNTTVNHEGTTVHQLNALETLFSKVLGSFFGEKTFYEKRNAESDFANLVSLIGSVSDEDAEYILKIAKLGRQNNMIQYPLALLTACFNDSRFKGENASKTHLKAYSNDIILRGQDIVDIMSNQINGFGFSVVNGKRSTPLPMQERKILRSKLESFNEYKISKALCDSREISMADCIKLLRPSEKNSKVRKGFYSEVIEDRVKMGDGTKQVQNELAKSRNTNSTSSIEDVKQSIDTSTLFAIVKNLVALERAGMFENEEVVNQIVEKLTDKKQVLSSKMLPFRFYSAYKMLSQRITPSLGKRRVIDAVVMALDLSLDNLEDIQGYNAVLIDRSGSMQHPISSMSDVTAEDIAILLGAICFKKGWGEVYVFANNCAKISLTSRASTTIDIFNGIKNVHVGGGTYLDVALRGISEEAKKHPFDNLILLSDNDCYHINQYGFTFGRSYNGDSFETEVNNMIKSKLIKKIYLDNLLGNEFALVNTDDYRKNLITGFSEKIIDMINVYSCIGGEAKDIRKVIDALLKD